MFAGLSDKSLLDVAANVQFVISYTLLIILLLVKLPPYPSSCCLEKVTRCGILLGSIETQGVDWKEADWKINFFLNLKKMNKKKRKKKRPKCDLSCSVIWMDSVQVC